MTIPNIWWLLKRMSGELPVGREGTPSAGQIKTYFEELAEVFDNEWARRIDARGLDPLLPLGGVQDTVRNVVRLGEILNLAGGAKSLPREVVTRLRDPRQHITAWYELEVSACFIQAGYGVTLYPALASAHIPDGVIRFAEGPVYYDAHLAREMFPPPKRWDQTSDPRAPTRRAVRNLLDKYKQLPEGEIGVLVMGPTRLLAPDDFQAAIDQLERIKPGQRSRVAGIILANKTAARSGRIRVQPTVIARSREAQPLLERMAEALWRFPE